MAGSGEVNPFDLITFGGLAILVIVIAAYDIYVWVRYGVEATITRRFKAWNKVYPAISLVMAFAMGCLVGHFFL